MASVLTAEVPAAQPAAPLGAIILARHGEPALSRKVKLSAAEYRKFWASYEVLGLLPGQTPPTTLMNFVEKCGTLVASTRLRSIESAQALAKGRAFTQEAVLIEAPLPPPNWPAWIRLSPRLWGFLARFWWWFFNHHEGQETRLQAEARADQAATMLIDIARQGEDVVVLAHGFFNFMIGRALRRRGWRLVVSEGYKYWSTRRFELPR
ncbi:histidine phosphatase family protein [Phenylobacterium hankyongense]|uniref:Histidine phosphatase family protein n=1 Tax=Phenylobacterium hankyongense TaxID=1813876 RepID=A0A328AU87_9CAUL|nr:histidine phosphatase family protein [Phenylobacterium hankyongense]RAK58603.1 histidine phosphatase family protein [Phenylobacterium hankyongense]